MIVALTLAKMPSIDSERLDEVYLPPARTYTMQRLARQGKPLESEINARKTRIGAIMDDYLPMIRRAFSGSWSLPARIFLHTQLNPLTVIHAGEQALQAFLTRARPRGKGDVVESHLGYLAYQNTAPLYELCISTEAVTDEFFTDLQEEIARGLRLMEIAESKSKAIAQRLKKLYQ